MADEDEVVPFVPDTPNPNRMEAAVEAASQTVGGEETGEDIERELRRLAVKFNIGEDDPFWAAVVLMTRAASVAWAAEHGALQAADRAASAGETVAEKLAGIQEQIRQGARAAGDDLAGQLGAILESAAEKSAAPAQALGREVAAEIGRSRAALIGDIKMKRKEVVDDWRLAAIEAARAEVRAQAAGRRALTWLVAPVVFLAGIATGLGAAWETGYLLTPGDRVQVAERTPRGPVLGLSGGVYRWSGNCSETLCVQIRP